MSASARLNVKNLTRHFGARAAVDDISFDIHSGQIVCLLGPSGCGKSTTLRMIAGIEQQNTGVVEIDGRVVADGVAHLPPEKREVGLVFQDFALFPHLNVADNIAFGIPKHADKAGIVRDLLAKVDLSDFAHAYPHELSGGEQQRVALMRALACNPKVMLMDEPFSSLDERLRDDVRESALKILKENGTGVLLVTHEPQEAMKMADHIILMRDGKIVQQGTPYTIYNDPVDIKAAAFFSEINIIDGVVCDEQVSTPFGDFDAPGHDDGTLIQLAIRPHHLRIEFDRSGVGPKATAQTGQAAHVHAQRARFLGHYSLIDFKLKTDAESYGDPVLTASVPSVFLPPIGTSFWLIAPRKHCYLFPKNKNINAQT